MQWDIFISINRDIFARDKAAKATFGKVVAGIAGLAAVMGAYWKAGDLLVGWLFVQLHNPVEGQKFFDIWRVAPHAGLHALVALVLLLLIYLAIFVWVAQQRLNTHDVLARSVGFELLLVKREHDVLSLSGRCVVISTDEIKVHGLQLSHIERRLQVTDPTTRSVPVFSVENLPDGVNSSHTYADNGALRVYDLNFTPPLHQMAKPAKMTISEEIGQAICMHREDTLEHPIFGQRVESISFFVLEPTVQIDLSVTFPANYVVGGASQISVRYGRTPTIHDVEEQRLKNSNSMTAESRAGRQTLRLKVEKPILGLHYYLYWVPPLKS